MLQSQLIQETKRPLGTDLVGPMSAGGLAASQLNFFMQHQEQTNWCWAAVTASVFDFYQHTAGTRQCEVVNLQNGTGDCCVNGSSASCNTVGPLDGPLRRNNNLRALKTGLTGLAAIQAEINSGRPLGCRVAWFGGSAHFVAVYGYGSQLINNAAVETIAIADPWYGVSLQNVSTFPANYQSGGVWTHSYFTKP